MKMDSNNPSPITRNFDAVKAPSRKYSWTEIKEAVTELSRELSPLSTMVPMNINFRKHCNGKIRIYFLRTPQSGWELTLLYTDVITTKEPTESRLEWRSLIDSTFMTTSQGAYSREEQLLWERQRVAAWGIANYELHTGSGRVLFPAASLLFVAGDDDKASSTAPLFPRSLWTGGGGAPLTPAMCPYKPQLVAHAAKRDIWLAGTREPVRLTYACKGEARLADDPLQAGVPSYVLQEEFSRYTGFWWQPKSVDSWYRIVYEEVDESDVKIYSFPSSSVSNGETEEFRYPRAGTANAKSILRMVRFKLQNRPIDEELHIEESETCQDERLPSRSDSNFETVQMEWLDLQRPIKEVFPWCEYIARIGWTPCGRFVWTQLLDRKQQRLDLVLISVQEFSEHFSYEQDESPASARYQWMDEDIEMSYPKQVLITETAPDAWINVHDILHFLRPCTSKESENSSELISYIWASEETGHLHLYKVTCQLNGGDEPRKTGQRDGKAPRKGWSQFESCIGPNIVSKIQLTSGPWEVIGKKIWVDERNKLIYFVGLRETPLERHLYVVGYGEKSMASPTGPRVRLLTRPGYSCSVDMDEDCETVVVTYSNISTPPACQVYHIAHKDGGGEPVEGVHLVSQGHLMEPAQSPGGTTPCGLIAEETKTRLLNSLSPKCNGQPDVFPFGKFEDYEVIREDISETKRISPDSVASDHSEPVNKDAPADSISDGYRMAARSISIKEISSSCSSVVRCRPPRPRRPPPPEILSTRLEGGCGELAYCLLWRPAGHAPGVQYPTVLHVYGGPEVQTVTNSYKGIRQLRMHMLAARGFCVVSVDSRGSKHRGRHWEARLRTRMGQIELDDQIEVLQWLAKETGCIDLDRVAVHGWSYGGYLSLLGLALRPRVFRACVAGAPVTCWRLYDTAYTERYMGEPHAAPHAYARASVLSHVAAFPDQENRLLIIHGLVDENVHFCHTSTLVSELVRTGKPHRLQLYPGERHSLRRPETAKHYEATLLAFLHEVLA